MVALYWLLKRLLTYWFINDVFPTLHTRGRMRNRTANGKGDHRPTIAQNDNLQNTRLSSRSLEKQRQRSHLEENTAHCCMQIEVDERTGGGREGELEEASDDDVVWNGV